MLSFFRRRTAPAERTFKARVEEFWKWYAQVAERFRKTIDHGQCAQLTNEISPKVDELMLGLAWVFGPGPENHGHSLTLSGEGILDHQLLCIYCVSRAPKLEGWTFYAGRQPGVLDGSAIEIAGQKFTAADFWLTTEIDEESKKLNIGVWHPSFSVLRERNERMSPVFLLLDEALGEFAVEQWLGDIHLHDSRPSDGIPLTELRPVISRIESATGWKKYPPGEARRLYWFDEPHERFLRGDMISANTTHIDLINKYLNANGKPKDPIAGSGAAYVFVAFDSDFLPPGRQVEVRGEIEDQLDAVLRSADSGRVLGGAFGTRRSYIDLLLFDGNDSLTMVQRVLRERQLPSGTAIHFFASDKPSPAIVL